MIADLTRRDAFLAESSESARLHARAARVMPGGNTRTTLYQHPYPPYAVRGRGAVVADAEGEERLDFINNYTSLIHGHADPEIIAAVMEQLQQGAAFALPTGKEVGLAETLVERIPSVQQVRFTNSGTEAVMLAIKAARAFTGRPKIAKFEGCYHGSSEIAEVSLICPPEYWDAPDPPSIPVSAGTPQSILDTVVVLPFNDIATTERLVERHRDELAAVLIDPLPMRAGLVPAEPAFILRLRELTRAHGIVMILDEVISLRLGWGGAQSLLGIDPDLTTMGKIIGGGFPVGGLGGRAEIMAVFDPSGGSPRAQHGGTFNANPITMAAGQVAMRKLTPAAFGRLDRLGTRLRQGLADTLADARETGQVTGMGSLFHVHLHRRPIRDYRTACETPAEVARRLALFRALTTRGILTSPTLFGCLSTPMGEQEIDAMIDAFAAALQDIGAAV